MNSCLFTCWASKHQHGKLPTCRSSRRNVMQTARHKKHHYMQGEPPNGLHGAGARCGNTMVTAQPEFILPPMEYLPWSGPSLEEQVRKIKEKIRLRPALNSANLRAMFDPRRGNELRISAPCFLQLTSTSKLQKNYTGQPVGRGATANSLI